MASGPLVGSNGGDDPPEKHRWVENKVYTRKSQKTSAKSNNPASAHHTSSQRQHHNQQRPLSSQKTLATTTDDVDSSLQQPLSPPRHPQQPPHFDFAGSEDDASSLNNSNNNNNCRRPPASSNRDTVTPGKSTNHHHHHRSKHNNGHRPFVFHKLENGGHKRVISLTSMSRHELRKIRRELTEELNQVRTFVNKLDARKLQLAVPAPVATGYSQSQFSANEAASTAPHRHQLSVSVATAQVDTDSMREAVEKEKRTPKASQYYRNSDFVLGKEKLPPSDSHKKSKVNQSKKHHIVGEMGYGTPMLDKLYEQALKSCATLLSKLMKHKHGWVFKMPVDVKGLGLHDYYSVIKHPMDLGTVKSRLDKNWYKSPGEFAEDVRLTFRNAMTYNPKGQDVHSMAEQLLQIFEERWPTIEAEYAVASYPMSPKRAPPPLDVGRVLERSDSTTHPVVPDLKTKPVIYTPHVGRPPAMKKPKAKDPHKRDMTYEEKQRLSNNLQSLPSEKLDNIVQIIKKRNSSLSQHDDEIEVDIDNVDTETLWELDRFVINYKKSLNKNKKKAELAILARAETKHNVQDPVPAIVEQPKESRTAASDEKCVASPLPAAVGKKADEGSRSSSSSSSSSASGSSSSDSDSGSSSAYGSDTAHSPRT